MSVRAIAKRILSSTLRKCGFEIRRLPGAVPGEDNGVADADCNAAILHAHNIHKVHYGCGNNWFAAGWVNVDRYQQCPDPSIVYVKADLVRQHPFPSSCFRYAYAEDFLEHLAQDESLVFLTEVYRCLQHGGVLRLSFPGLENVLTRHFAKNDIEAVSTGIRDAYTKCHHKHFYCKKSLMLVADAVGFSNVTFSTFGCSSEVELAGLDHRAHQKTLNIYAELTK